MKTLFVCLTIYFVTLMFVTWSGRSPDKGCGRLHWFMKCAAVSVIPLVPLALIGIVLLSHKLF